MDVERRLDQLGLTLPAEAALPADVEIPFAWVRIRGTRAYVSGHGALAADGSPAGPFGKIPSEGHSRRHNTPPVSPPSPATRRSYSAICACSRPAFTAAAITACTYRARGAASAQREPARQYDAIGRAWHRRRQSPEWVT